MTRACPQCGETRRIKVEKWMGKCHACGYYTKDSKEFDGSELEMYKMIEKAMRLVRDSRVEHLEGDNYNVIGDHGTYSVVIKHGVVSCNCPGFRNRGRCSHSAALEILRSRRNR